MPPNKPIGEPGCAFGLVVGERLAGHTDLLTKIDTKLDAVTSELTNLRLDVAKRSRPRGIVSMVISLLALLKAMTGGH